jgi:hypothetical protein
MVAAAKKSRPLQLTRSTLMTKKYLQVAIGLVLALGMIAADTVRSIREVAREVVAAHARTFGLQLQANTITNLIPTLFEALDIVSREMIGFIPAVSRDSGMERAALNQTINVFIAPPIVGGNVTPGATPPSDGDAVLGNTTMTITKSRYWPVRWNGEEQKAVGSSGQMSNVLRDQFAQAFRAAANEVEADLAALHVTASRAFGTNNVVPFGTAADLSDFAQTNRILNDNGAPLSDRKMVLGAAAWANLSGKQAVLFKVNEAGTDTLLRQGIQGRVQGYDLHNSNGVANSVAIGTSNGAYTSTNAGFAVGTTSIPLITGAGTIIAGDIITFAGDTNKYIVTTGIAAPGTVVIAEPGLRQAIPAVATAVTTVGATARNMFFSKSAMVLGTRPPALPEGGDMADDRMMITDPVSGITFEVSLYRQYRQVKYEVALAWGVKNVAPRHTGVLIGT